MRPGADLVLDVAPAHGLALALGAALDDHLSPCDRAAIDSEARSRYERWRVRRAAALTVERVDLTEVWEVELIAQCFLPAARLRYGLTAALETLGSTQLAIRRVDGGMTRLATALAAQAGAAVSASSEAAVYEPAPRAPLSRLAVVAGALGMPARVRGEALCVPYWHLYPAIASLSRRRGAPRPFAARLLLPGLGHRGAAGTAARGGWMGIPGRRARSDSRRALAGVFDAAGPSGAEDPIEAAIDACALATLRRLAHDTLACVRHARHALAGRRVRLALLPFDSPEQARMLLAALRDADVRTLLVQHGFPARQGDPDMRLADHLAIWSEHDRSLTPDRDPASVTVSGNPGAAHLAGAAPIEAGARGRSLVLVDYPGRLTARIEGRVSMRHVAVALAALARARPGTTVVVRPHPGDMEPDIYRALAAEHPALRVRVDACSPIQPLLASADLCVGSLSTAALQACALGVPTVFLDVAGIERPWPFDGALPSATDAVGLAEAIASAIASREVVGRSAALEALGVRKDAVERVVELAVELAR